MDTTTELGIHDRGAEIADLRAENERLRAALMAVLYRYDDQDMNHVDFRMWAKHTAAQALETE